MFGHLCTPGCIVELLLQSSLGSSNEEAAEEEELQAIALQKRMAATLQEEDFEMAQLIDSKSTTAVKPAKKAASDPVGREGKRIRNS